MPFRTNPAPAARATSSEQITEEVLGAVAGAKDVRAGEILAAVIRHAHDLPARFVLSPPSCWLLPST